MTKTRKKRAPAAPLVCGAMTYGVACELAPHAADEEHAGGRRWYDAEDAADVQRRELAHLRAVADAAAAHLADVRERFGLDATTPGRSPPESPQLAVRPVDGRSAPLIPG